MKSVLTILSCLVLLSACKKEIDELPPATDTGANTFGAKVDGKLWVPQKNNVVGGASILEARRTGNNGLFINARNFASSPDETEFEIYIHSITGPGTYPLDQLTIKYPNQVANYGYYIKRKLMPENEWMTSNQFTGTVVVTKFDQENKIVAGTFEFTAGSIHSIGDPVKITEGRFDVKLP